MFVMDVYIARTIDKLTTIIDQMYHIVIVQAQLVVCCLMIQNTSAQIHCYDLHHPNYIYTYTHMIQHTILHDMLAIVNYYT